MFEKSLTQLKAYTGSSPKPADFDQFWERALCDLDAQTMEYELVPADFTSGLAECFHLYFTGVGGAKVHCKYVRPKNAAEVKGPAIVMFHGYSCDSGDWMEKVTCAALEPRIKLAVPVYPFLSDYKRAWELDITTSAYEEIHYYFRFFDPHHEREEAIFNRLGYIDIQNLADRIQAKVLWVTGLADTICPPSTQFAAYNKITATKDLMVYHEYGHEYLPYLSDRMLQTFMTL